MVVNTIEGVVCTNIMVWYMYRRLAIFNYLNVCICMWEVFPCSIVNDF